MPVRAPEFWHGPGVGPVAAALAPLGFLYGLGVTARRAATAPWTAPVPVVCVGNLVAGGAGKTPVALDLGVRLATAGRHPHFVSRGYGGAEAGPLAVDPDRDDAGRVGDEPLLLARARPTWVARDRRAGIEAAARAGADLVVLDDGFQNPTVAKDLALVVVDAAYGFGNGLVFPAGPLREPVAAGLARADAVVVLGGRDVDVPAGRPVLRAALVPDSDAERLNGRSVVAFAGIGRPRKVFATLESMGCRLRGAHAFPDHHPYRPAEIAAIRAEAERAGAVPVTTAKDAVRLPEGERDGIAVLGIEVRWQDPAALDAVLSALR